MDPHDATKALYDIYPVQDKDDFFKAYLYMKYLHYAVYKGKQKGGLPAKEPPGKPDAATDELLDYVLDVLTDGYGQPDTSPYHGKVIQLEDAVKLVTQKEDITLQLPEKIVPFKMAKDLILINPDSIAVTPCPCRLSSPNSCLPAPMEGCIYVGEPFASFMVEHARNCRRISQQEAVEILQDCHERGFVHSAYFKKDHGRRFYAICNCCSCCCGGIQLMNMIGGAITNIASSGYVAEVSDECSGCGTCAENTCHFQAISMNEAEDRAIIDFERCMGCGVCADVCPAGAISLGRDPSKGEPLDIEELQEQEP